MSLSELIPALRSLSQAEKLNAMQFLLAEVSKSVSDSSTGEPELTLPSSSGVHPTLRRQGGVLVIETSPIDASAFSFLVEQVREERTQKLISVKVLFDSSVLIPALVPVHPRHLLWRWGAVGYGGVGEIGHWIGSVAA